MAKVFQTFYSRESLEEIACKCKEFNDAQFIAFQVQRIKYVLPTVEFSKLAINCLKLKEDQLLDGYLDSVVWGAPDSIINSYLKNIESDDLNPLALVRQGEAIHSGLIRGIDEWFELPVINKHCWLYDINAVIAVSYGMPFKNQSFISFNFMGLVDELPSAESNFQQLEHVTLPFYLAWLYRKGILDADYLSNYLQALEGLSAAEVRVLRALWKPQGLNIQRLSYTLNIQPSTVNKHIEQIIKKKRHFIEAHDSMASIKVGRVPFLMMLYSFLQWA